MADFGINSGQAINDINWDGIGAGRMEDWDKSLKEKSEGEMIEYSNSQISELIDDYIHNARNRAILKDRLIDGLTYERIAEIYDMSYQQVRTIIYKEQEKIFKHI